MRFLASGFVSGRSRSDKAEKRALIADHVTRREAMPFYAVFLDADDVPHPELFAHVAGDNNGHGYVITHGYAFDVGNARVAPLPATDGAAGFETACGSCLALAVAPDWTGRAMLKRFCHSPHRGYVTLGDRFGRQVSPVPFRSMLYVINHGENRRRRLGLDAEMVLTACRDRLGPGASAAVLREFGVQGVGSGRG